MLGRTSCVVLAVLLCCCIAGAAFAADIVSVPTANQLKAGEVDVAAYYFWIDQDGLIPGVRSLDIDNVRLETLYAGLTDRWEIDVLRQDVDVPIVALPGGVVVDGVATFVNVNYLALPETAKYPAVVVGGWDVTQEFGHASWYVCTAKTLNPPVGGPPTGPIYRLHLSLGTGTEALFAEERHQGIFGGLQVLVRPMYPQVGLVGLWDGTDVITAVCFTPDPKWPTFKGGTFGDHWWAGLSFTFNAK